MVSVFVSYCRKDRAFVNCLLDELKSMSIAYWLDETDIKPSMEFNDEILSGLNSSQWFMVAMTPRSAQSEYVKDELHWALTHRNGRILPVVIEECDPASFHLRMMRIQYVDLSKPGGLDHLRRFFCQIAAPDLGQSLPVRNNSLEGNLELISLLLAFISRFHQKHIRNLTSDRDSERQCYIGGQSLRQELRDLCNWGILRRLPGIRIAEQVRNVTKFVLSDVVQLTDMGKQIAPHIT